MLANLGQLILGVGAAWEMTRLSNSATMVALVQTAMMLPLMLASVPAGAIADMFDRRKVAMAGLLLSSISAAGLAAIAYAGLLSPWLILIFCFLIGSGVAVYSPAWQASINEQVGRDMLPAAVALGTISYNVARSFGPALGGVIVLAFGAVAAFSLNAVFYIPLLLAFFFWRRRVVRADLPPEGLGRAIVSGTRYVAHSPILRRVLFRAFLFGLTGATGAALAPLIARDLLGGDAATYGIVLGASGAGAVIGALLVSNVREHLGTELASRILIFVTAVCLVVTGWSDSLVLTCAAMFFAGAANIMLIAMYNVVVQLSVPHWVIGRAVSLFGSALTGGIALGSVFWGEIANLTSVSLAVMLSGGVMALLPFVSLLLPVGEETRDAVEKVTIEKEPEIGLPITMQSGPLVIEIDYRVDIENAPDFYRAACRLRPLRLRNGGYGWSIARDVADPSLWTERYACPTWADYLHVRDRYSAADVTAQNAVSGFLIKGALPVVRRRLERPFGSVRGDLQAPDANASGQPFLSP